jgi:hypothetical protein
MLVGTMQLILIVTGVTYMIRDRRNAQGVEHAEPGHFNPYFDGWNGSSRSLQSSNIAPDEQRPLLSGPRPAQMVQTPF